MKDGFLRVAVATPNIKVADCKYNSEQIINLCKEASSNDCSLLVYPELSITGYTCGDLFLQSELVNQARVYLDTILKETSTLELVFVVGLPYEYSDKLYNVAAVCCKGSILGFVPKMYIPSYGEFYEARHFESFDDIDYVENDVPFGNILFESENNKDFVFGVEICEDLWVANAPSNEIAIAGAKIICNPSASNEVIGKSDYRRKLVSMQSAKLLCSYLYADAGLGESTQDLVFSGHSIIAENGTILSESKRYSTGLTFNDIDLKRLVHERKRITTFGNSSGVEFEKVLFDIKINNETKLVRTFPKKPFVPSNSDRLKERCEEILSMQATALATRIKHIGCKKIILGLSGGLDSTLALIVCVRAYNILSMNLKDIIAVTMPGFGTTNHTKNNSIALTEAYGVTLKDISIVDSVSQHFKDISHESSVHDVAYENSQARERTQILMDLANKHNGIVVGTGDLSELALGWATYNGDHMSMYGVNCSVPKTLVRFIVSFEAENVATSNPKLSQVLHSVVDTPVSPELLPPTESGDISQKTEDLVGPYDLHDFFLYYFVRFGYEPSKIYRIACLTFADEFDCKTIYQWLETFICRFFAQQFKRSCLPDGPKIGTVSLSPRGDWRMPSDASCKLWLDDLKSVEPK